MASVRENYARLFGRGNNTERLVFFSDAVFAIALTLLVVDLRVPEVDDGQSAWDVIQSLIPGFLAFAISFTVIAINWFSHFRKFRVIKEFDGRLMAINFVLLFLVAFTPFPTSLIAEYPSEVASVVLYASVVTLLNLTQLWLWSYAYRHTMMDPGVDLALYRFVRRNILVLPIVFGSSILVAIFWDPTIAMYSWFLLYPATLAMRVISRNRG